MVNDISKKLTIKNEHNTSLFRDTHILQPPMRFEMANTFTANIESKPKNKKNFFIDGDEDIVAINNSVHFNMIYCGACRYIQNTMQNKNLYQTNRKIKHSFWLAQTEVTQELYEMINHLGNKTFNIKSQYEIHPKKPIHNVSFYDAIEFCNLLSNLEGLDACYKIKYFAQKEANKTTNPSILCDFNKNGYRLPSYLEWNYVYHEMIDGIKKDTNHNSYKLEDYAWYNHNFIGQIQIQDVAIQAVATKKPSTRCFYDLIGNVSEWCWNEYTPIENGSYHYNVGGSWRSLFTSQLINNYLEQKEIVALTDGNSQRFDIGFRLARTQT